MKFFLSKVMIQWAFFFFFFTFKKVCTQHCCLIPERLRHCRTDMSVSHRYRVTNLSGYISNSATGKTDCGEADNSGINLI